jgi:hypothetical protein
LTPKGDPLPYDTLFLSSQMMAEQYRALVNRFKAARLLNAPASRVVSGRSFLIAVLLSVAVVIALVEWIGWSTGATVPPRRMAAAQDENQKLLVLPPDLKYWASMKLGRIAHDKPEIVFIGTSRCNQFRSAMFSPYIFYNACLTAWTLDQVANMLDLVTRIDRPRVVMFALDYFMFTDQYEVGFSKKFAMEFSYGVRSHVEGLADLERVFLTHPSIMIGDMPKYVLGRKREGIDHLELLGVHAIEAEAGFRYDGSFLYERGHVAEAPSANADPTNALIKGVPGGTRVDPRQLAALARLAQLGKERGVTLVGIQCPILKSAVDYLDFEPSYHSYAGVWREFEGAEMHERFRQLGVHFFDLSRDAVSEDARNFVDPAHPSERGVLGALVHLLDDANFRSVFPRLDADRLRNEYANARKDDVSFDIYRDRF